MIFGSQKQQCHESYKISLHDDEISAVQKNLSTETLRKCQLFPSLIQQEGNKIGKEDERVIKMAVVKEKKFYYVVRNHSASLLQIYNTNMNCEEALMLQHVTTLVSLLHQCAHVDFNVDSNKTGTLNVEGRESAGLLTGLAFRFVSSLISELVSDFVAGLYSVTRTKVGSCNMYETKAYEEGRNMGL